MNLTQEECNEALEHIKSLRGSNYGGYYSRFNNSAVPFDEDTNILNLLIKEHFDNPPLKFEELKKGMFAWDNKQNTWIEISEISEYQNIEFYMIGWECKETIVYEPNRFYRRKI